LSSPAISGRRLIVEREDSFDALLFVRKKVGAKRGKPESI